MLAVRARYDRRSEAPVESVAIERNLAFVLPAVSVKRALIRQALAQSPSLGARG